MRAIFCCDGLATCRCLWLYSRRGFFGIVIAVIFLVYYLDLWRPLPHNYLPTGQLNGAQFFLCSSGIAFKSPVGMQPTNVTYS